LLVVVADGTLVDIWHRMAVCKFPSAVLAKGGHALHARGQFFTTETIQERLVLRNYPEELRGTGVRTGGQEALGSADRKRFADQLDRFLTKQAR
jgi:uncharacterized protein